MNIKKELTKGSTALLVLSVLEKGDMYGYRIIKEIEMRSEFVFSLKEGTLYPILYRLEDDGMIQSSWTTGEGRSAPKKVYSATEQGRERCLRQAEIWKQFVAAVDGFEEEQI